MSLRLIITLLAILTLTVGTFGTADAVAKKRGKKLVRSSEHAFVTRPVDPYAVYWAGTYVGSDPDPNIRAQLLREFQLQMHRR